MISIGSGNYVHAYEVRGIRVIPGETCGELMVAPTLRVDLANGPFISIPFANHIDAIKEADRIAKEVKENRWPMAVAVKGIHFLDKDGKKIRYEGSASIPCEEAERLGLVRLITAQVDNGPASVSQSGGVCAGVDHNHRPVGEEVGYQEASHDDGSGA